MAFENNKFVSASFDGKNCIPIDSQILEKPVFRHIQLKEPQRKASYLSFRTAHLQIECYRKSVSSGVMQVQ